MRERAANREHDVVNRVECISGVREWGGVGVLHVWAADISVALDQVEFSGAERSSGATDLRPDPDLSMGATANWRLWISISVVGLFFSQHAASNTPGGCAGLELDSIIPQGWVIFGRRNDVIPEGHYWGQDYIGLKGRAVALIGTKLVIFEWKDRQGKWYKEALGRESLELYFMPSKYMDDLNKFRSPKRPRSAELIYEGAACRIYGHASFKIIENARFDELVKDAAATQWAGAPQSPTDLSWENWKSQVRLAAESLPRVP